MKKRACYYLAVLVTLWAAGGATCPRNFRQTAATAPTAFETTPTLQEVMTVVNQTRANVSSVYSTRATLSGSGFPGMRATLAIGSPRQVRLRAGTGITGSELDIGSNHQMFWMWAKRNEPPAVYYGNHELFDESQASQVLPVRPEWLVEALGLVYLDPAAQHQGPVQRSDGRLEIRTAVPTRRGFMTKVLVIDARSGWVHEHHLFGPNGRLVASAVNSQHLRDPATGVTLPRRTDISWPDAQMKLTLELHELDINPPQLSGELWTKPEYSGFPNVNITPQNGMPYAGSSPPPPGTPYPPANPYAAQRSVPGMSRLPSTDLSAPRTYPH